MKYELQIYSGIDADHPEIVYSADEAFGGFAVGDAVHPVWRLRGDWPGDYYPGDRLLVARIDRIIAGRGSKPGRSDVAQLDTTLLYCNQELGLGPGDEHQVISR